MNESSRKDKSLFTLTKKFVEMLKTQEVVDLNIVTSSLNCAKKRRIYDVSNVLEGIGLFKKTQKNLYHYMGRTYKEDSGSSHERVQTLKEEKETLEQQEKELESHISSMKMNCEALAADKSYMYLTRQDFIDAFGKDATNVLIKDYRTIKVQINDQNASRLLHIQGYVVKPISVQLVNSDNSEKSLPLIDLELSGISSNSKEETSTQERMIDETKRIKKSDDMILFRRNKSRVSFVEADPKSNEELSKSVLSRNKFEGKSKFYYIHENSLVLDSDYQKPDFLTVEPPADLDYSESYSSEAPSIHDLFDYTVEPVTHDQNNETDEIMEEEYIIEELDEEYMEMMQ